MREQEDQRSGNRAIVTAITTLAIQQLKQDLPLAPHHCTHPAVEQPEQDLSLAPTTALKGL